MVYGTQITPYNYLYTTWIYKPTYNWGAHIVETLVQQLSSGVCHFSIFGGHMGEMYLFALGTSRMIMASRAIHWLSKIFYIEIVTGWCFGTWMDYFSI